MQLSRAVIILEVEAAKQAGASLYRWSFHSSVQLFKIGHMLGVISKGTPAVYH